MQLLCFFFSPPPPHHPVPCFFHQSGRGLGPLSTTHNPEPSPPPSKWNGTRNPPPTHSPQAPDPPPPVRNMHTKVDTDMAKANANKAPDPETRKLLWLKIARREVERCRSTDIEGTMRVLQVWCQRRRACACSCLAVWRLVSDPMNPASSYECTARFPCVISSTARFLV